MLHILLLILKIIGIILLVIFGLLIVLLSTALLVPVRYQITAKTEEGIDRLCVVAKATWILHLVSAFFSYKEKKTDWKVRIFWKKYSSDDKKKEKSDKNISTRKEEKTVQKKSERISDRGEQKTKEKQDSGKSSGNTKSEKKVSWIDKIKCTIRNICGKIKKIWETKEKLSSFLKDEIHQAAFQTILHELKYLTKHARPRKAKGFVRFGFEDPYKTGQALAVLSILYPFYGEQIAIYPEFEQAMLQGDISIKGYIRLLHFVKIIWTFLFDKNVRKTYEHYKAFNQ